jgi:hypothetical protein
MVQLEQTGQIERPGNAFRRPSAINASACQCLPFIASRIAIALPVFLAFTPHALKLLFKHAPSPQWENA